MATYNNENEHENAQDGESHVGVDARASRKGTGFMTHTDEPSRGSAPAPYAPEPKRNLKKPLLYLIGIGGLAAGTVMWLSPHDQVVEAERTRYASREACLQDWNAPEDCEFVSGGDMATAAAASSDAAASAASDASGSSHGGSAHGAAGAAGAAGAGGGGWGGGQASRASADDATRKAGGGTTDSPANGPLDTGRGAETTNGGGGGYPTSSTATATSGWYGPYYTRDGVVYHESGLRTTGVPVQHGIVSMLAVRESALSAGSTAFHSTPRAVSVSEGRAISRGGFMSAHGEGGGHGGGEGGGGHGSGGG
jgi:hypothetical protein